MLYDWRLFHPVLDTFVYALPVAYASVAAPPGNHSDRRNLGRSGRSLVDSAASRRLGAQRRHRIAAGGARAPGEETA
jgi:hypothetical protein